MKRFRTTKPDVNYIDIGSNLLSIGMTNIDRDYTITVKDDKIIIVFTNRFFGGRLPHEILDGILDYLSIEEIVTFEKTSKNIKKSIQETKRIINFSDNLLDSIKYPQEIYNDWPNVIRLPNNSKQPIRFTRFIYPINIDIQKLKNRSFSDLIKINSLVAMVYQHLNNLITEKDVFLNSKGELVYYSEDGDKIHFIPCDNDKSYKRGFATWIHLHAHLHSIGLVEDKKEIDDDKNEIIRVDDDPILEYLINNGLLTKKPNTCYFNTYLSPFVL